MQNWKREFITFMMQSDVLRFGEFTTKSGRISPYFINAGNYRTGGMIAKLGRYYARCIDQQLQGEYDALFGPAYKGIPLVTAAAMSLYQEYGQDKPYFFNRKEAKDHGEGGTLVGYAPQAGDRIIIIEDVITAGTALRESMEILGTVPDLQVKHMFISVDRCEVGQGKDCTAVQEALDLFGVEVHPIIRVTDILEYLCEDPSCTNHVEAMRAYMDQYCTL